MTDKQRIIELERAVAALHDNEVRILNMFGIMIDNQAALHRVLYKYKHYEGDEWKNGKIDNDRTDIEYKNGDVI